MAKVFVSLGLPKSASSFMTQLSIGVMHKLVYEQGLVPKNPENIAPNLRSSFPGFLFAEEALQALGLPVNEQGLDELIDIVVTDDDVSNEAIVIKSHLAVGPRLKSKISAGQIIACASIRHPADVMLSFKDHLRREEEVTDEMPTSPYRNGPASVEHPVASWASTPGLAIFDYDELAQYPYLVARKIALMWGYTKPSRDVVDQLFRDRSKIWQYNKGVLDRSKVEMTAELRKEFETEHPGLMALLRTKERVNKRQVIGVVIPAFNSASFISQTLLSIVSQHGDFDIHVHVQDGESTDDTMLIVRKWQDDLSSGSLPFQHNVTSFTCDSRRDSGMYEALQRGFDNIDADWFCWIGSDDAFLPAAFQSVVTISEVAPDSSWLIGSDDQQREDGVFFRRDKTSAPIQMSQRSIAMGRHDGVTRPLLQQEGIFWNKELWIASGQKIPQDYKLAGDFALWIALAQHAEPLLVDYPLAAFRRRSGQLSENMENYHREVAEAQATISETASQLSDAPLSMAHMQFPSARWVIARNALSPGTHDTGGESNEAGVSGRELNQEWSLIGAGNWEMPIPEIGLHEPFCWLLKSGAFLKVKPDVAGNYLVTLTLANLHENQSLTISGPGVKLELPIRLTEFVTAPVDVSFESHLSTRGAEFHIAPTIAMSTDVDSRELGVMIMAISLERVVED